ncbi:MAG: protein kinase [Labilithrix sp.]|nr:protein kinase [Labilithrix sp.]
MGQASGDTCLVQQSLDDEADEGSVHRSGPRPVAMSAPEPQEEIDYVAFASETGSLSKMALVKRRTARLVGSYTLGAQIGAGGMATVHLGRRSGPGGFSRTVAIKRLHGVLAKSPELVQRFVDEARIASRVRHGNVVQTLDVVTLDDDLTGDREVLLVLEYVHGESLARLRRCASAAGEAIPPRVAAGIVVGVLRGLHAAHEATSADGSPLDVVHRDVSPQNVIVGADGIPRVIDFGIAKAAGRVHESLTRDLKGKLAYMAPEQLSGARVDRRADLFAAGVVLWEALAGERLFRAEDAMTTMEAIYNLTPPPLAERPGMRPEIDAVLAKALAKDPRERYESAQAMARAIERALPAASDREIGAWVEAVGADRLAELSALVAAFERDVASGPRLVASREEEPVTMRRDALVPPPLALSDVIAEEAATLRVAPDEAETPLKAPRLGRDALDTVDDDDLPKTPPHVPTPFAMALPISTTAAMPGAPIPRVHQSGITRVSPAEQKLRDRPRAWTPIPMPEPPRRAAPSLVRIALLVVVPPLIVLAGVLANGSSAPSKAAAGKAPAASTSAPPAHDPVVAPPVAPVAPPQAPAVVASSPPATPTPVASAKPARAPIKLAPHRRSAPRPVPRRAD